MWLIAWCLAVPADDHRAALEAADPVAAQELLERAQQGFLAEGHADEAALVGLDLARLQGAGPASDALVDQASAVPSLRPAALATKGDLAWSSGERERALGFWREELALLEGSPTADARRHALAWKTLVDLEPHDGDGLFAAIRVLHPDLPARVELQRDLDLGDEVLVFVPPTADGPFTVPGWVAQIRPARTRWTVWTPDYRKELAEVPNLQRRLVLGSPPEGVVSGTVVVPVTRLADLPPAPKPPAPRWPFWMAGLLGMLAGGALVLRFAAAKRDVPGS